MKNMLKEYRAKTGISQGALADRLGVSRQSINAIETGRWDPSLPLAFELAAVFECKIEDLFCHDKAVGS
jgi:putative transcriptional regulator